MPKGEQGGREIILEEYKVVYQGGRGEIVEKKSRFIANVFPVASEEEAQACIEETKKKYWDARHNCHAFVLGGKGEVTRCSDDGEPSGTAGRPMLEVLLAAGIRNVLVVVTRYFGGTLLGTGGLIRAYTQAAQAGLEASRIITRIPGRQIRVVTDYNGVGKLQYIAGKLGLPVLDTQYTDIVTMAFLSPLDRCDSLVKEITEATAGQAQITLSDELYYGMLEGKPVLEEQEAGS